MCKKLYKNIKKILQSVKSIAVNHLSKTVEKGTINIRLVKGRKTDHGKNNRDRLQRTAGTCN